MKLVWTLLFGSLFHCQTHGSTTGKIWNDESHFEREAKIRLHDVHSADGDGSANNSTRSGQRLMVIHVASSITFYVKLEPQLDTTLHSELKHVHIVHENYTEQHDVANIQNCQFVGHVISPVKGRASVHNCPYSREAYAMIITDGGMFHLRPRTNESHHDDKDKPHVLSRLGPSGDKEGFCGVRNFEDEDDKDRQAPQTVDDHSENATSRPIIKVPLGDHGDIGLSGKLRERRASDARTMHIETAIFVDRHMFATVQRTKPSNTVKAVVNIVMAILHQVQLIYEYESMTTFNFKLVVVKFEILKNTKTSPDTAGGNIDEYLNNFSKWQCKRSPQTGSKGHWDHAIMLTGLDMFKLSEGKKNDRVLGLAWVNGICRCLYSCTINEATSAEAAFVIAHELGHNLGMQHDGTHNDCDSGKYIMSNVAGPGKVHWSKCSNDYVKRVGQFPCLTNVVKPASDIVDIDKLTKLPGEDYTALEQCQMAHSVEHVPYMTKTHPFNDICRELWCRQGEYAMPSHPAFDGTECAQGKWCREGRCLTKSKLSSKTATSASPTSAAPTGSSRPSPEPTPPRKVTTGKAVSLQRRRLAFKNLYGRFSNLYG